MGEIRTVDDDQRIGPRGDDGGGGLADAAQNQRQARRNRVKPIDADAVDREQAGDPRRRHGAAADTGELERAAHAWH